MYMSVYRCIFTCVCIYIHVNETMMDDSTIAVAQPASRVSVFK